MMQCNLFKVVDCIQDDRTKQGDCLVAKKVGCVAVMPKGYTGTPTEGMKKACTQDACSNVARCK